MIARCLATQTEDRTRMNPLAVLAAMLGVTVVTVDMTLTSTAIPAIASGIGAPPATAIWIINAYYLIVIAALLPLAALGEIYGHRKVFLTGLMVFAIGSLACGFSTTLMSLIFSRAFLGLGAAAVAATVPALVKAIYPANKLASGLGLYAMIASLALTLGPTISSIVLSITNWPWLYFQTVPIASLALLLAAKYLPHTQRHVRPFDGISALLCAAMLASVLFAIAGAAHLTWPAATLVLAGGLVCGYWLIQREAGQNAPIFSVDLFAIPVFSLSAITSICAFSVQGLAFVMLPFLLTTQMGFSPAEVGWLISPWPIALILMPLLSAHLVQHIAPGKLGFLGLLLLALGLWLIGSMPNTASAMDIGWRLVLCAIGFGFFQSPNMFALMTSAPNHRSGGASGILATSRLLGQAIGAALVAYCLATWPQRGLQASIWFGCGLALIGALSSVARLMPALRR